MIRPVSKNRPAAFLFDFQVFKGKCQNTMKAFGQPVCAAHEARLLIKDDAMNLAAGETALYAIHQRSEHRILSIVKTPRVLASNTRLSPIVRNSKFPLSKAA